MSYTRNVVFVILILGAILSFHDTYWPWALVPLMLSALVAVIGLRLANRRN